MTRRIERADRITVPQLNNISPQSHSKGMRSLTNIPERIPEGGMKQLPPELGRTWRE